MPAPVHILFAGLGLLWSWTSPSIANARPPSAPPPDAALFVSPPTDISRVRSVSPLGTINPGRGHVFPKDHLHIAFMNPNSGGADEVPVFAMAAGKVVGASRSPQEGAPPGTYQYEIFIQHDESVTVYYDHLNDLSARILGYLNGAPASWTSVGSMQVAILGQLGAPDPLPVAAGEQVGIARSYFSAWDIGVVDRRVRGEFVGHGLRRYPAFDELAEALGLNLRPFFPGNQMINAVCFLDYLAPDMRQAWFDLLESEPKTCGQAGWDIEGKLRGNWFNPAADDAAVPPLLDLEYAGLSLSPDARFPGTRVQIGIGSKNPLAAFDPTGLYPQLAEGFSVAVSGSPGSKVNPDPAQVDQNTGTVCYDLFFRSAAAPAGAYNVLYLRMDSPRQVRIRFDGTSYATPQCPCCTSPPEDPGFTVMYVR